jgi:aldehyde dehydrogenase (NAD+)
MNHDAILNALGLSRQNPGCAIGRNWGTPKGQTLDARSPIDGSVTSQVAGATEREVQQCVTAAAEAFLKWRVVPAPVRGEFVRRIGEQLRRRKADLAALVTLEAGKITTEALGEVQEMIDICDFAVGLSRQLYGLTIASERPGHRMMEQWHPIGPVGVISAFNFPVAVWAWNAMIGLVCGDPIIWKPSEKTPLTALATHAIMQEVLRDMPEIPDGLLSVVIGDARSAGEPLVKDPRVPVISATGSVRMGMQVAQVVAARLGRSILELGGNNAMILTPSANMDMAIRAITFASVGTCGQRCTSLRRLIVHKSLRRQVVDKLLAIHARLKIGDPRQPGVLMGPLIDKAAFDAMEHAMAAARDAGATVHGGGRVTEGVPAGGYYVRPALAEISPDAAIVREETFAPLMYVIEYENLEQAIAIHNNVPQGLSSAIFTSDVREAELFLSPAGSDCGIANVNIGTSGAEIGGAFGGEKHTGGGRESGSDSWKAYMRRATNTINYSTALPLAQGVEFPV